MQEEISKHSRKIYKTVKSPKHTVNEKIKEIIIEIFIIVFAVSLSIWLHSWSEHNHEQKESNKFLKELKADLEADAKLIEENKKTLTNLDNDYKFILSLKNLKTPITDSLVGSHSNFYLLGSAFNVGRYEGFKSSGKIGTIENDALKNEILAYYQQTLPNLTFRVNFINSEQLKIKDADSGNLNLSDFYTSQKMQSNYSNLSYNSKGLIDEYQNALKQINQVLKEIDAEK
ncbi:hypothetical protein [Epilithonimonas hungarica]|uniref:Uncharacterized protein n=1 Tax=Epilithonimonas hungarica TaxID=454006 RepID=A0A1G7LUI4_9FLAO|nr:hypothetical protein [Epilithonimonas hungarica]SDF53024.1 hypothetical protein SAMN05421825_1601 [Epilithonimonas hungarica]